ncbi:MAG: ABC transporter substrate binding protein, partial [Bacteroidales bacterium]|nr:ABC transporter substrate binding protein [Bacteroidales bacterium]
MSINESTKKVLLVHSYHKGYKWTDDISLGIEAGLPPNAALYTEFLDSKRISPEDDYFKLLLQLFKYKTDIHKYDLIICSDNNAFDFIQNYCNLLNYHPPVVFCGLNELEEGEIANDENITGVNESADLIKGFELIHQIHPLKTKLIFITDNTPSGQRLTYQLKKILADSIVPFYSVALINNIAMPDLLKMLNGLGQNAVVYYTFFMRDSLNHFYEYNKSSKMICDASPVPVYGGWDFNMGSGLLGGYLVSGYQQGFKAAELAGLILSGTPVNQIPIIMDSPNQYIFDYEIAKKFNIDIAKLEQYGQVINRPYSAFEQYKEWIYGVLGILFLLIIIVILLTINALIRRRSAKKIGQAKEILETTLNSIGDGVIATDVNGVITNMNLVAVQLTGWAEQDAISEPLENVFKILHSVSREPIKYPISGIISSRKINEIVHPTVLISKNGREFQVATKVSPIIHHDNSIFGIVIVFRDVSEEYRMTKALKASEKKFRNYIQASSIAIFILNKSLKLTYANPAAVNLTGYSIDELIKIKPSRLLDKQGLNKLLKLFKPTENNEQIKDLEIKIGQKGGNQIFILLDAVKLNNDDHILYCRDVDELKNIQAHLAAKNQDYKLLTEELQYKIADLKLLNSQLAEAKERAEE